MYLDVTVLDKAGYPVVTGLGQADFRITEDKRPQSIFSFEAPETHVLGPETSANREDENPEGKAPATILVLDLLDSSFADFGYIRYEARKFLLSQPSTLTAPVEMMVVGNTSLEMIQSYTRNRQELLDALEHLPPALPWKEMNGSFVWERFTQSIDALQQIALQNAGIPGRKNLVWVGHGGPGVFLDSNAFSEKQVRELKDFAHLTTNLLVGSRISLYVIYPGLSVNGSAFSVSSQQSGLDLSNGDPFVGDINFGLFANATGGKLYFNRNDLSHLMARSLELGSNYYTLTYQPSAGASDGKFRRIRVTVERPGLRVVTKAGYFAANPDAPANPHQQAITNLCMAAFSTVPFHALPVRVVSMVRHPDSETVEVTVNLGEHNLIWEPTEDGKERSTLLMAAASLHGVDSILASHMKRYGLSVAAGTPAQRAALSTDLAISVKFPRRASRLRVVIESEQAGRMGAIDLTRKEILAAPAAPTPSPALGYRPAAAPEVKP